MNGSERGLPGWLRARLEALPESARAATLLAHVRSRGAWFLQLASADAIEPQAPWTALGLDSLRAVDFRGELARDLDLDLRSTLLFDQPNPQALVAHLLERLPAAAPAAPRVQDSPTTGHEPIAIVGAACRFPGGESLDEFRQMLVEGRDAVAPIPPERFDVAAYYDPDPNADGKLYVREAALLSHIDRFDAACFGISPREAVMLDPQQRLLLETSLHALEHANLPAASLRGGRVGVYVGMRASAYFDSQSGRTAAEATAYQATGNEISTAAGRIAYTFGFQGPCYALDTACSGSLVAVHVAVRALRARECDAALAGGVNTIYDPVTMSGLCRARMLSPDGRSKTFDASANGYGRGEGCGIVVLKRLSDALAAGDRVLAIVRGTSINQDGRSGGLTVPHGPAQTAVIHDALADAGVGIDAIDYVEAHGTGTALGDPIEVGALDAAFAGRTRPLPIGSVKTNIGHLEAAAGISGLLKVVLALQARTLPKNLHFRTGNPHIDWQHSLVRVVTTTTPLPNDREVFAGVSSFGFSGTNCHVVLSSPAAASPLCAPVAVAQGPGPWLLPLQAATPEALRALAGAHAEALATNAVALADWCHATAVGRADASHRAAFVAMQREDLAAALRAFANGNDAAATAHGHAAAPAPPVAFLFPGQGAQRAGMGRELHAEEPVFRDAFDAAAARLADVLPAPLPELTFGARTDLLDRTDATQPVLCAYELALLALFRSVGVQPEQVIGHSVGDFPAAVAAGVMDGGDALRLCAARGRLMVERCPPGGMLVVQAPRDRWQGQLAAFPHVSIAVQNAEANTTVGGDVRELLALQRQLEAAGVPARMLPVSHAFHTAHTEPMLSPFAELVAGVRLRPPERGFVDCRRGGLVDAEVTTAAHWRAHVRERVDFQQGLRTLAQGPCRVWIELGPTPMLAALAREAAGRSVRVLCAQRPGHVGRAGFLAVLADAWVLGIEVDLAAANHGRGAARATLPSYPLQRQRFWLERSAGPAPLPGTASASAHPLLGTRIESSLLANGQALFQAHIAATQPAWLADHKALGQVLLPATAMLEVALAAEAAAGTPLPLALRDVTLRAPRPLRDGTVTLELVRAPAAGGGARFTLHGRDDDSSFRTHLDGESGHDSKPPPAPVNLAAIAQRCPATMTATALYARAGAARIDYGPAFRLVHSVRIGDREALTTVQLPPELDADPFVLHPALLDACLHAIFAASPNVTQPFLPIGFAQLIVFQRGTTRTHVHLRLQQPNATSLTADLDLLDDHGGALATLRGLQLVPADADALQAGDVRDLLHHVAWEVAPPTSPSPPPTRLAIVGHAALAHELAARLPAGGTHVTAAAALPAVLAAHRIDTVLLLATEPPTATTGTAWLAPFLEALQVAQTSVRLPQAIRIGVVTHGTCDAAPAPAAPAPFAATVHGLWRTLALEHPATRPFLIDLDPTLPPPALAEHAAAIAAELRTAGDEPEVALRSGQRRIRRLRRGAGPGDRLVVPTTPFRLRTTAYGWFEHLACQPLARKNPGPDEIEVAMTAAALNFKDVLHARGMLREFAERNGIHRADQQPLGFEGCGVVVARGANVRDIAIGDTVVVQAVDCIASHVTLAATNAFVLPAGLDAVAAAGSPIVGATVLHALADLARVQAGETVLVHAAAGGVGQAAIAWLRAQGCRVLATTSASKRAFVQGLGVEVVGDSRGGDFSPAVLAATANRGVDVVLNTLSGDTVPSSLRALRRNGRFVELGKLGVWSAEQVRGERPDVTFFAFDLGDEYARDPLLAPRLLARVRNALVDGSLRPPTTTVVPLARVRTAFHHLSKGHHTGKVVVSLPQRDRDGLRPDRTFLLTGASGGIAPAIANALADAGARQLALLSRSVVEPGFLASLRARGVAVTTVRVDVTDRVALAAALQTIRANHPPIGGVVHAAGTLADAMLVALDGAHATTALAPKVAGALLLDELLAADPLEHFVLLGSMAATLGNPGQAAYAAANSFLEAFASWRRSRGRPATTIAFGPWDGGGMATRLDERLRARLRQSGVSLLPAATAARLLLLHRDPGHDLAVLPVRWAEWMQPFRGVVPKALLALQPAHKPQTTPARLDFAKMPVDERSRTLRSGVRAQIATVLGFADPEHLALDRTFRDFGLDSLLAVDAKDRLERLTGLVLPATLLFDHPDLERLVAHLHDLLFSATATPASADLAPAIAAELRHDANASSSGKTHPA